MYSLYKKYKKDLSLNEFKNLKQYYMFLVGVSMDIVTQFVIEFVITIYIISAIMFFISIVKGPTIFDRVIAIDALSYDLTVFIALIALYIARPFTAMPMVLIALWTYALDLYISKSIEYNEVGE